MDFKHGYGAFVKQIMYILVYDIYNIVFNIQHPKTFNWAQKFQPTIFIEKLNFHLNHSSHK